MKHCTSIGTHVLRFSLHYIMAQVESVASSHRQTLGLNTIGGG
jgi:hypothetical protein